MASIPQSVSTESEVSYRAAANESQPTTGRALALTAMAYLPAVLCMMTVGVVVPFIDTLTRDLGVSHAQIGLSIALFSIPSAFLATLSGGLIDKYGADALRFTMAAMESQGRDIKLDEKRVEGYRNFATKLWNAARFLQMNGVGASESIAAPAAELPVNRWIIGEVVETLAQLNRAFEDRKSVV